MDVMVACLTRKRKVIPQFFTCRPARPQWMEKGKQYATQTIDQVTEQMRQRKS